MRKHNPIPILSFLVCVIVSACGKPAAPIGVRIRPEMAGLLDRTAWSIVSSVGKTIEAELLRIPGDEEAAKEPDTFFYLSGAWRLAENAGSEDGPPFAMVVAAGVPVAAIAGSPPILEWLDSDSDMTPNLVELLVLSDPAAYDVLPTHLEVRNKLDEGFAQAAHLPMLESDGVLAGAEGKIFFQARAAAEAFVGREVSGDACTVNGEEGRCDPPSWSLRDGWNAVHWGAGETRGSRTQGVRSFFIGAAAPKTEIQEHAKGVSFACKGDLPGEIKTADALTGSTGCLFECAVGDKGYRFCPLLTYIPVGPGVMAMRVRARSVTGAVDGAPARWKYRTPAGVVAKNSAARIQLTPQRGQELRYCVDREDRCVPSRSYQEPLAMQCSTNGCSFYVRMTEHTGGKMAAPLRSAMFVNDTDLPTLSHSGDDAWHKKAGYTWTVEASDLGSPITAMRYCVGPPGADYCGAVDTLDRVVTAGENTGGTDAETPYAYSFPFGEADLGGWMAELCTGGVCEIEVAFIVEDSAGNRSDVDPSTGETDPHHLLLRLDDTAPTMLVSAPAATNTDATVQVAVNDTGAGVPTALLCVVPVGQTTCTPDTPVSLDAGGKGSYVVPFRDGTVQLYLQATDAAGNSSEVKGLTITFDRNGPLITIPAVDVIGNGSEIEVQIYEGSGSGITAVTACFGVSGSGICPEGSPAWAPSGTDRQGVTITMKAQTSPGNSESKTLIVVAMDAGGNVSVGERTFTVDGTPPGLSLTTPATLMTTAVPLVLTTASSDAGVGEVSVRYCSSILSPAGGAALKAPYSLSGTDVPPCSVPGGSLSVGGEIRLTPPPRSTGGYASVVVVCAQASDGAQNAGDVVCTHILVDNVGGECTVETGGDGWHKWSGSWTGLHKLGSAASWVEEGILYVARCTDPGLGEIKGMKVDTWANGKSGLRLCNGAGCTPGTPAGGVSAVRSSPVYSVPLTALSCAVGQVCKRVVRHQLIDPLGNPGPVREKEIDVDLAAPAGSTNVSEHGRSAVLAVTEEGSGLSGSEMSYACDNGWEPATGTVPLAGSGLEAEYCVGSCLLEGYTDKAMVGCKAPAGEYGTLTSTASVTLRLRDAVGNVREERITLKKEELRIDKTPPTITLLEGNSPIRIHLEDKEAGVGFYRFKVYCAAVGTEWVGEAGNLNGEKSATIDLNHTCATSVCSTAPLSLKVEGYAQNRFGYRTPEASADQWTAQVPLDRDETPPSLEILDTVYPAQATLSDGDSGLSGSWIKVTCEDGALGGENDTGRAEKGEPVTLNVKHTCPTLKCVDKEKPRGKITVEAGGTNCTGVPVSTKKDVTYEIDCTPPTVEGVYEALTPDGGKDLDVWSGGALPVAVRASDNEKGSGIETMEAFVYWGETDDSANACSPEKVYEEWDDASRLSFRSIPAGVPLTKTLGRLAPVSDFWLGAFQIDPAYRGIDPRVKPVTEPNAGSPYGGKRWNIGVHVTDRAGNAACAWSDGFWAIDSARESGSRFVQWPGAGAGNERGMAYVYRGQVNTGTFQGVRIYPRIEKLEGLLSGAQKDISNPTIAGGEGRQVVAMSEHNGKAYAAVLVTRTWEFVYRLACPPQNSVVIGAGLPVCGTTITETDCLKGLEVIDIPRVDEPVVLPRPPGPGPMYAMRRAADGSGSCGSTRRLVQWPELWIVEEGNRICYAGDLRWNLNYRLASLDGGRMQHTGRGWAIYAQGKYTDGRQPTMLYPLGRQVSMSGAPAAPVDRMFFPDGSWGNAKCVGDWDATRGAELPKATWSQDFAYSPGSENYSGEYMSSGAFLFDEPTTGKVLYGSAWVPYAQILDNRVQVWFWGGNGDSWQGDDLEEGWFSDGNSLMIPGSNCAGEFMGFEIKGCGFQFFCKNPLGGGTRMRAKGPLFKNVGSTYADIEIDRSTGWEITWVPYGQYEVDRGCNLHILTDSGRRYSVIPAP